MVILSFFVFIKGYTQIFVFFFFQAEDGIRDGTVTGVQTCALPICSESATRSPSECRRVRLVGGTVIRVSGSPAWVRSWARLAIGVSTRTSASSNIPVLLMSTKK